MSFNYLDNLQNMLSEAFFEGFKFIVIVLTILLIISLILLAIGCLVKSQKLKSKFLKVAPSLLIGLIFVLVLPFIFIKFKNLIK